MENLTKEELVQIVGDAVESSMKSQFKSFYIPPEKHYKQHEFLENIMKWTDGWKSNVCKAIAHCIVGAFFLILLLGFITWGSKAFKISP